MVRFAISLAVCATANPTPWLVQNLVSRRCCKQSVQGMLHNEKNNQNNTAVLPGEQQPKNKADAHASCPKHGKYAAHRPHQLLLLPTPAAAVPVSWPPLQTRL